MTTPLLFFSFSLLFSFFLFSSYFLFSSPFLFSFLLSPMQPISICASKFCSWVLGVVDAARWQRKIGAIEKDNAQQAPTSKNRILGERKDKDVPIPFHQKLAKEKARRLKLVLLEGMCQDA